MGRVIRLPYPISGGAPPPGPPDPPPPPPPPPPGIPALVFSPPGAAPGSYWIEGSEWHFIAITGEEWAGTGVAISAPSGAVPGSYWVEDDDFRYVDESGVVRALQKTDLGGVIFGAHPGSFWIDPGHSTGQSWMWHGTTRQSHWWNGFPQ